ncbi:Glycoside hydrolase, family 36 [Cordyceps fumosorosea ARSEF 2679]|uniref:Alpha-galactosidase n=1 Tax=Cordyceps fumosorosea (strain ARSEF 2679) TaxID=1081104 RepID=A0A168BLN1_CORFA|nr:Glycoside hydrolase, family 36 [Cordyceps fumosorosea ARSEF 2679]OAA70278.1 Glycoside hydrolase, family 36 [Cordyceps fumosorosea ARSEF 2679]
MRINTEVSQKAAMKPDPIVVDGTSFALNGRNLSYRFHVDAATGDLVSDHFGAAVPDTQLPSAAPVARQGGWSTAGGVRREFPDLGRGDFRTPAFRVRVGATGGGGTVTALRYHSHEVIPGKPALEGLPSTVAAAGEAATLVVCLQDERSRIAADLSYTVFPELDIIARSVKVTNQGTQTVTVEKLTSISVDLPHRDYDMISLRGEWTRECNKARRAIDYGSQGFGSTTGYSSHFHNPFLALAPPTTTESHGEAWGFALVYSGSFRAEVEKNPQGLVRAQIGLHDAQLSWPLGPGETLVAPECVAAYSAAAGVGGMSRALHRLHRRHLMRGPWRDRPRPVLLNGWEGVYFDFDGEAIVGMAAAAADLGVKLFVMDDGWFGVKHPRTSDGAGLGDWTPNPARFPDGLKSVVDRATTLAVTGSDEKLKFGIWVEPEMVNPRSELFESHPDWVLQADGYPRTEARNQLVLNLALPAVQDFIIDSITTLLRSAPISYVKWDNNRGIHETASPAAFHAYLLGLYRVLDTLTTSFPDVLWEGCASGGGRFDAGMLPYFPQSWASDNTDPVDRVAIQFGTTVAYPAAAMGAHVAKVPNETTRRVTSLAFRTHVAMMGGSFGFELDPRDSSGDITPAERLQIPGLIKLAEKINPLVINGDMWKLDLPGESNHPAALFLAGDGSQGVLFAFQMLGRTVHSQPTLRFQGLAGDAKYRLDGEKEYSGAALMNGGLQFAFAGDYDSRVVLIERL